MRCGAALAALLTCCLAAGAQATNYSANIYRDYYKNGTTPTLQSFASAKSVLNGLPLRCAIYTILQNNTWYPDNVRSRRPGTHSNARCDQRTTCKSTAAPRPCAPVARSATVRLCGYARWGRGGAGHNSPGLLVPLV
jgi:hypothetical protein